MFLKPASQTETQNPNTLRSTFQDDPEMGELIAYFVDAMGERVAAMSDALEDRDLALLQRLAHQLKGTAKGYGFAPITRSATALEDLLRDDPTGREIDAITVAADRLISLCMHVSV